jgi:hypothetical protein
MQLPEGQVVYSDAIGMEVPPDVAALLLNPTQTEGFGWPIWAIWGGLLLWFLFSTVRHGKLTFAGLIFLSATTLFWQEFFSNWGAYLVYSPKFPLMAWDAPFASPNKPWFMIASYGNYYVFIFSLMLWAMAKLRNRFTGMSPFMAALLIGTPLFYAFNIAFEAPATTNGWWAYMKSPGPHFGNYPLLFPILPYSLCGVIMATVLSLKTDKGVPVIENVAWVQNMRAGFGREFSRFLIWSINMNLMYWFLLCVPVTLFRLVGIV